MTDNLVEQLAKEGLKVEDAERLVALMDDPEVLSWDKLIEKIITVDYKGQPPHDLMDRFHATILWNKIWASTPIFIQRSIANGMALGYLLAKEEAKK